MVYVKLVNKENDTIDLEFADLDEANEFLHDLNSALDLQDVLMRVDCPVPTDTSYLYN